MVLDDEHGKNLPDDAFIAALCSAVFDDVPATEPTGRAKFQIAVTVCQRCRRGWQEGAGAQIAIAPAAVDRAMCDAQHIGSIDGSTPERAHQDIPPSVARFVWRRDGGRCRVDGCRSSRGLELHHLIHRAEGGSHDASNIILACSACHQSHHDGVLTISGTADHLEVRRPGHVALAADAHGLRAKASSIANAGAHVGAANKMTSVTTGGAHMGTVNAPISVAGVGAHVGVAHATISVADASAHVGVAHATTSVAGASAGDATGVTTSSTGAHVGVTHATISVVDADAHVGAADATTSITNADALVRDRVLCRCGTERSLLIEYASDAPLRETAVTSGVLIEHAGAHDLCSCSSSNTSSGNDKAITLRLRY